MVQSRVDAQIVVTDSDTPSLRSQLAMMMVGGSVMHSSRLMGQNGFMLSYKRVTRTPKMVHITAAFKTEFPGAAHVISNLAFMLIQNLYVLLCKAMAASLCYGAFGPTEDLVSTINHRLVCGNW